MNQVIMKSASKVLAARKQLLLVQFRILERFGFSIDAVKKMMDSGVDMDSLISRCRVYGKPSKYLPHQGKQECARRRRHIWRHGNET